MAGGKHAVQVAAIGDDPRLVERRPHPDPTVERAEHDRRVLREPLRDVGIEPAAQIVERGRKVPVIQRDHGLDVVGEQRIDETIVEVEAGGIHRASPARQDPAPGNTEAIRVRPEGSHQRDVVSIAPIVVAGDVARGAVADQVRGVREPVPDARTGAVGQR
jgi:hypothetical protein